MSTSKAFRIVHGLHENTYICSEIDLSNLLKLPLRDR